jgi:hypothetical protein
MDDLYPAAVRLGDLDRRIAEGWDALDRHDLAGARAALRDVHAADPAHAALPELAAGIRRIRPKPIRWRAPMLAVLTAAAIALSVRWSSAPHPSVRAPAPAPAPSAPPSRPASAPPVPPSQDARSAAVPRGVGTAGRRPPYELPGATRNVSAPPLDEDVVVRQVIQRFEGAYQSRWGGLAFSHCDINRELDRATATCRPRGPGAALEAESDAVWTFSLRKAEGAWRIASVQPPPGSTP